MSKCRCRNRRGGRKRLFRSPDEALASASAFGLDNVEPYRCPARNNGKWHLRTRK